MEQESIRQTDAKKAFRASCLQRLKKASGRGAYVKDKKLLQRVYEEIATHQARTIMLYLPLRTEVDIYPLIRRLRKEKRRLYVPFMEGESFRLVKYRLPLEIKKFGIKEPKNSRQYRNRVIDLAVVPIVGLDATQRRVGFGKGMYDRFFEREGKYINKTLFLARELCYSDKIITDEYDVRADVIIVPK